MMKCPRCTAELVTSNRKGVETDVCPACRGVWLDRGELDKIISRYDAYDEEEERENYRNYKPQEPQRKRSFFSEFFD